MAGILFLGSFFFKRGREKRAKSVIKLKMSLFQKKLDLAIFAFLMFEFYWRERKLQKEKEKNS